MIELSFAKLLLLAVIALVVLGPEKLPKAARMAGAMLRRLRSGWDNVRSEVERELEMEEIRRAAKEALARAQSFEQAAKETAQSTRNSVNDAVSDVSRVAATTDRAAAPEPVEGARDGDH